MLDGFKSYAVRTTVSGFDREFNAITGLNGSGKSNILDSICFVLGISNLTQVRARACAEQRAGDRGRSPPSSHAALRPPAMPQQKGGRSSGPRRGSLGRQRGRAACAPTPPSSRSAQLTATRGGPGAQVRAANLQELVYKQGQAGVQKASVTLIFNNEDTENSPLGYEQYDKITVTRQVRRPLAAFLVAVGLRADARRRVQVVIGGRNKYLINAHTAQLAQVQVRRVAAPPGGHAALRSCLAL